MGSGLSKATVLETMLKNFKKGFSGDYRVKLTPGKLRTFCEVEWPAFGVGWPSEGTLDGCPHGPASVERSDRKPCTP